MQTRDFDYRLPPELIAQQPAAERAQARLMLVDRATGALSHYRVADLPSLLQPNDLMVLNDTRVIPARVFGKKQKTGGRVEVLFIGERYKDNLVGPPLAGAPSFQDQTASGDPPSLKLWRTGQRPYMKKNASHRAVPNLWEAFLHSSGRPKVGDILLLANDKIKAQVKSLGEYGRVVLEISCEGDFFKILAEEGVPPLPPYIKRPKNDASAATCRQLDMERYQTVYARLPGAIAAPTAGLHFSENLLAKLEETGVQTTAVTLHVGPGTFVPVRCDRVAEHKMESERYIVGAQAAQKINRAINGKRRIVAVGTTVVRVLESVAEENGLVTAKSGRTEIFIYPPYPFKIVGALLTNFHLPRSTLLMLVSAFAGRDLIRRAYETAVREKYRFYSYGDGMLIV